MGNDNLSIKGYRKGGRPMRCHACGRKTEHATSEVIEKRRYCVDCLRYTLSRRR